MLRNSEVKHNFYINSMYSIVLVHASFTDLMGKNELEDALIDSVVDGCYELWSEIRLLFLPFILNATEPPYLVRYNKLL